MRIIRSLVLGVAVAGLAAASAQAAEPLFGGADPIYSSSLFNFEGFYVGATLGAGTFPGPGIVGTVGVVAGANFALTDGILTGVEFQGDALWNGSGFVGFDALLLGKIGGYLSNDMVVYGTGGGGWADGVGSYALGAGIEMAVADQVSVRGELMGTGGWGGWFDGGKATVGVLWHMD
jgi:outer membrane immunogenic protein